MNAVAGILFDLDGTLVDSAPDIASALDATLQEIGLAPAGLEQCRHWIGSGVHTLVTRALESAGEHSPTLLDETLSRFMTHYRQSNGTASRPFPGAVELLQRLRAVGKPLACVTNKSIGFTTPLLDMLDLSQHFDAVIGGDSLARKKPHPAPLLEACRQLNSQPAQSLMIGDSITDQKAARAANIPFIWISHGYHQGETADTLQPTIAIDALREPHAILDC